MPLKNDLDQSDQMSTSDDHSHLELENDLTTEIASTLNQSEFISPDRKDHSNKRTLVEELENLNLSTISELRTNPPEFKSPDFKSKSRDEFKSPQGPSLNDIMKDNNTNISIQFTPATPNTLSTNDISHSSFITDPSSVSSLSTVSRVSIANQSGLSHYNNYNNNNFNNNGYNNNNDNSYSYNSDRSYVRRKRKSLRSQNHADITTLKRELNAIKEEKSKSRSLNKKASSKFSSSRMSSKLSSKFSSNHSDFTMSSEDEESTISNVTSSVYRYRRYYPVAEETFSVIPESELSLPVRIYSKILRYLFETRFGTVYSQRYQKERSKNFVDLRMKFSFFIGGIFVTGFLGKYLKLINQS